SGTQAPPDVVERLCPALGGQARKRQPGCRRHRVSGAGAIEIDVGEPTRGTFLDCLRATARSLVSSALLHGSLRKKTRSPPSGEPAVTLQWITSSGSCLRKKLGCVSRPASALWRPNMRPARLVCQACKHY